MQFSLWILITLLSLGGLVWIYNLAAPVKLRKLPTVIHAGESDPKNLVRAFASHFNAPGFGGTKIQRLRNGCQIFPSMLESIDNAHSEIVFLTYVFWRGPVADQFARALAKAAGRGVTVRILIDAVGGKQMEDRLVSQMKQAGCKVHFFNPIRWFALHRSNSRTHRKILVVDRKIGFTGGVGIASEWEGDAQDETQWRDTHFLIEGPILNGLESAFDENWRVASGEVVLRPLLDDSDESSSRHVLQSGSQATLALGRPGLGMSKVALAFWFAILVAQKRIWIQTPYFIPSEAILEALERAAGKGIDVRLMIPGVKIDSNMAHFAARTFLPRLVAAGVKVLKYQPTMLHSKIVLVDDEVAVIGSANFDHRSFELNYETVMAVEDSALVGILAQDFIADQEHCRELTSTDAALNWKDHTFGRLVMLFRYQL